MNVPTGTVGWNGEALRVGSILFNPDKAARSSIIAELIRNTEEIYLRCCSFHVKYLFRYKATLTVILLQSNASRLLRTSLPLPHIDDSRNECD